MITYIKGNMFEHEHDCFVNTINCCGAMGAGIALAFRERHPLMYGHYRQLCLERVISPGDCWPYIEEDGKILLGLAVKHHWKNRIRVVWAKLAVRSMIRYLEAHPEIQSVALPRIGSANGGRGQIFTHATDNWPEDSEEGYQKFQPFFLAELEKLPKVDFTIYSI